ncbi:MAG: DUF5050 domain-containing protein, partial [Oscillospiraceae bacterium]|nr:DUF5050 domain-containing protein [Oscillospiraceae bacterium]
IEVNGYVNAGIGYGGGSRLTVYALNDSMLHIIRYEDEDTNAVTNEPLFIRRGGRSDDEFFYRDGVKEIYTWSDSEGTSYALLSDGSLHFLDSLGGIKFHPSDSQKGIFSAYTVTAEPYLSGVNRLFGNRYANFGVMYTLSDDDGNLYVGKRVDRNADYFKVELPAVYTDMDIKSVYSVDGSGKDIIVEFNDGNIYFTQNAESGEELTHHEELSRLNTENRILRIEAYDRNLFIVLCDDGNLYKLDLTRSLLATGSGSTSTTNPNPPSTLLGNVIGNSDVATDGKNDYYIGKTNGQQMLIKEELSSGKKEILFYTANLHIKNINIINDRLYFSCYETVSPHLNGIYTMKTDGTEGSFIYNGELTIRKMVVVGDYLYFTYGSSDVHLYSMKNDGSELKQLEKTNYFDVLEDGSIDTQAKALGNTEQRIESGGWIYFKNADDKYNIYKMRSDGSEITYLSDGGWDINVVGDRVYYSLVHLHRVRTDGSKDEIVFENDMFITDLPDFQYILEY